MVMRRVTAKKIGAVLFQLELLLEAQDMELSDRDVLAETEVHLRGMYDRIAVTEGLPRWRES